MDRGACQAIVHGVAKESDVSEQLNRRAGERGAFGGDAQ